MESQVWPRTVDRLRGVDPAVVAIDGLAGSGKTMLTAGLAQIDVGRPVSIIQADCLVPPQTRDWRLWTAREGYGNYLDHARLGGEILIPLSEGRSVQYRPFNWTH